MASMTYGAFLPYTQEVAKTANYSVLLADSGTLFTTFGAAGPVTFTLPTLALGVAGWWGFASQANQNMIITAPANKLIADGNLTGTTGTYSTASHIIGSFCQVWMNAAGTFYILQNAGGTVVTVT